MRNVFMRDRGDEVSRLKLFTSPTLLQRVDKPEDSLVKAFFKNFGFNFLRVFGTLLVVPMGFALMARGIKHIANSKAQLPGQGKASKVGSVLVPGKSKTKKPQQVDFSKVKINTDKIKATATSANLKVQGITESDYRDLVTRLEKKFDKKQADPKMFEYGAVLSYTYPDTNNISRVGFIIDSLQRKEIFGHKITIEGNKIKIPSLFDQASGGSPTVLSAQFMSCMSFIFSLDDVEIMPNGLTRREDALMGFGTSIVTCSTGFYEGVAKYYETNVPQQFRVQSPMPYIDGVSEEERRHVEPTYRIVFAAIQECMASVLSSDPLIREVTQTAPEEEIGEQAHQVFALKDRIGARIGHIFPALPNEYKNYSPQIYEANEEDLLQSFYRYFTPERITEFIMEKLNAKIADVNDTEMGQGIGILLGANRTFTDYDEENDRMLVTAQGVLHILKKFKFVSDSP